MNTVRRVMLFVLDMAFVLLALNALAIVFGFVVNPWVGVGHGHWTATGFAVVIALALRTFIWLLPLTALVFLIGSLISREHSNATIAKEGKNDHVTTRNHVPADATELAD